MKSKLKKQIYTNLKNYSLDSAERTLLHREIIQNNKFLKKLYTEFYQQFNSTIKNLPPTACLVELGSGGGFIKDMIPNIITSDIISLPNVDKQFSALKMPFESYSVDDIFMINVLHHIHNTEAFLTEASRCLKIGGKLIMIEPANTWFSKFIYKNFHHELFDPEGDWHFETKGPLSSANGALPWIIFYRDQKQFSQKFPQLKIIKLRPHTPFRYLLSGGLSKPPLAPSYLFGFFTLIEKILSPLNPMLGMFVTIQLEKIADHN
ncbi:MAG: class I SAM-dependent methyltransferase [Candidatus Omnitrophica bacterium]|nr:class I SAM-dependent methyltransferase [Candidatus Omnitrophota bacterium]